MRFLPNSYFTYIVDLGQQDISQMKPESNKLVWKEAQTY